ncbi:MAG: hypothetical protein GY862_01480 [Gammaproteobacteria bacterium]|nr:hypothetical protein [Gammaproteobacteria bacterium]
MTLIEDSALLSYANFNAGTGIVHIPLLEVSDNAGSVEVFSIDLQLLPQAFPIQFTLN